LQGNCSKNPDYLCPPYSLSMLKIDLKDNEAVDKALKRFKKKFEKTGVLKELRARQAFEKPSIRSRQQRLRAVYRQQLLQTDVV